MASAGTFIAVVFTGGGDLSVIGCSGGGCCDDDGGLIVDDKPGITNGGGPLKLRGGGELIGDFISV